MSYQAHAAAIEHPGPHPERLQPALALPLIAAMSVGGWWLVWQAERTLARLVF
jgi:hypothetical protein